MLSLVHKQCEPATQKKIKINNDVYCGCIELIPTVYTVRTRRTVYSTVVPKTGH